MSFDYIHETYGVRFKRGQRVICGDKVTGTVTRATHYIWVRADGKKKAEPWHPADVKQAAKVGNK